MSTRSLTALTRCSVVVVSPGVLIRCRRSHRDSPALLALPGTGTITTGSRSRCYATRTAHLFQSSPLPPSPSTAQQEASDDTQHVARTVRYLQSLALRRPSSAAATARKTTAGGVVSAAPSIAEWTDVLAELLADSMDDDAEPAAAAPEIMVAANNNNSSSNAADGEGKRLVRPAWEAGLEAANTCASSATVAEWLLFLCLSSREDPMGGAAPFEVCDGVYAAWRAAQRGVWVADERAEEEEGRVLARPSPLHAKGVHHHCARWLLREYHVAQEAMRQLAPAESGSAGADEFDAVAAHHHAQMVLNRVMEVLLLDLPADEAAAAAAADAASAYRVGLSDSSSTHRQHRRQSQQPLRPTTALLVLEACRQLALFVAEESALGNPSGTTLAFPLLATLTTPAEEAEKELGNAPITHHNSSVRDSSRWLSPLCGVARAAFEAVLITGTASPLSLRTEALALYLGFLMASAERPTGTVDEIERFVRCASQTARRLAAAPLDEAHGVDSGVSGSSEKDDTTAFDESRLCAPAAAAVRDLLTLYVQDRRGTVGSTQALRRPANADDAPSAQLVHHFADLLLGAVPAPLARLFVPHGAEAVSGPPRFSRDADETERTAAHLRPVSWCAWMLRVLFCDLRHVRQQQQQQLLCGVDRDIRGGKGEVCAVAGAWQAGSEWMISTTARLVIVLRHASALSFQRQRQQQQQHQRAPVRHAGEAARRPLQEVWRLVFEAALLGTFFHTLADPALPLSHRRSTHHRNPHQQQQQQLHAGENSAPPPQLLRHLCYPHYDKSQWRSPSVNLYLRLLEQWGQTTHVRNVFATVARRESDTLAEVQAAVAAEQQEAQAQEEKEAAAETASPHESTPGEDEGDGADQASGRLAESSPLDRVCRRYHPALLLHSCLITLRMCGVSRRALSVLLDSDDVRASLQDGEEEDSTAKDGVRGAAATSVAEARLAGTVLQYMLCSLHVVERKAMQKHLRSGADDGDDLCSTALMTEGYTVAQWVGWVGTYAVPEVEQLYRQAGLEAEWAELGY